MKIRLLIILVIGACLQWVITSSEAKKMKEYCYGNGCISGGGMNERSGWHECGKSELNVCRKQATEKPK